MLFLYFIYNSLLKIILKMGIGDWGLLESNKIIYLFIIKILYINLFYNICLLRKVWKIKKKKKKKMKKKYHY